MDYFKQRSDRWRNGTFIYESERVRDNKWTKNGGVLNKVYVFAFFVSVSAILSTMLGIMDGKGAQAILIASGASSLLMVIALLTAYIIDKLKR